MARTRGGAGSSGRQKFVVDWQLASRDPDVHYGEDDHFATGSRGVSEWTITGTEVGGDRNEVRGCDLWEFGDDGLIVRKDSFWKLREP